MVKKANNMSELVSEAICASMEFEKFMDQTDFDSWLEEDKVSGLEEEGQQVTPFRNYKKNKRKLKDICRRMVKQKETGRSSKIEEEPASVKLENSLVGWLFKAKIKRLDARITSSSNTRYYIKSIRFLLRGLNALLNSSDCRDSEKYWLILYYNDLSICYSGLNNSFLSQGYAKEALKIIKKEKRYKNFDKKVSFRKSVEADNLANDPFVSYKLYDLYLVAIFNQAQAERRSYQRNEAERDFRTIIDYVRRPKLTNFNYYSAIVGLGDLYIEQGRGKEAIELLGEVIEKTNEDDIRHWKASLTKIGALVDQSEYDDEETQKLLGEFITKSKNGCPIQKPKHRLTYAGFKGLELLARCDIERVRDSLKMSMEEKELKLQIPTKFLGKSILIARERKQKGFEQKAYKYLGDIHAILEKDSGIKENLARFVSKGEISDLCELVKYEVDKNKTKNYINECEDLDVLESLSKQVCKLLGEEKKSGAKRTFLKKTVDRLIRECVDKDCLARAEKTIRITHEFLEEDVGIKNLPFTESNFDKKKSELFCSKDIRDISPKNMRRRLDTNEKNFHKLLFGRHEDLDHVVEVIVLKRWNSFSPGLSRRLIESLGGGYFLRIRESSLAGAEKDKKSTENIVIDPGYNFLQNLCGEGFSVEDIDTIIVTHSHLDHCSELRPIMDLIFQINKRNKKSSSEKGYRKVNLCLSPGAYRKFSSYIEDWREQLKDVVILDPFQEEKWERPGGPLISAIKTHHVDLGDAYAMGLRIEIDVRRDNTTEEPQLLSLGFTGDTPWYPGIREDFKGCDLLCVHLGTIKYQEIGYTDDYYSEKERDIDPDKQFEEVRKLYAEKANHLLCFGTQDVIASCANRNALVIVGEFGEELKYGLRKDLCQKFDGLTEARCIPGDI